MDANITKLSVRKCTPAVVETIIIIISIALIVDSVRWVGAFWVQEFIAGHIFDIRRNQTTFAKFIVQYESASLCVSFKLRRSNGHALSTVLGYSARQTERGTQIAEDHAVWSINDCFLVSAIVLKLRPTSSIAIDSSQIVSITPTQQLPACQPRLINFRLYTLLLLPIQSYSLLTPCYRQYFAVVVLA